MNVYAIRTANDGAMEAAGVGNFYLLPPSRNEAFVLTLDRVLLTKGPTSDVFSLRAMDKAGRKFDGCNGAASLVDEQLNFRAVDNLYKQFAFRLTCKYVRDAMMNFGGNSDYSGTTNGELTSDGE